MLHLVLVNLMAPFGVHKGKKPMGADDPASQKSIPRKGSKLPEGIKLTKEQPCFNEEQIFKPKSKAEKKFKRRTNYRELRLAIQERNQSFLLATIFGNPVEAREVQIRTRFM